MKGNGNEIIEKISMLEENKFIGSFLCIVAAIMIICFEFITEKLTISRYMERDRKGIINNIIISMFVMIFAIPILIFTIYLEIE